MCVCVSFFVSFLIAFCKQKGEKIAVLARSLLSLTNCNLKKQKKKVVNMNSITVLKNV